MGTCWPWSALCSPPNGRHHHASTVCNAAAPPSGLDTRKVNAPTPTAARLAMCPTRLWLLAKREALLCTCCDCWKGRGAAWRPLRLLKGVHTQGARCGRKGRSTAWCLFMPIYSIGTFQCIALMHSNVQHWPVPRCSIGAFQCTVLARCNIQHWLVLR